jgi:hypothetical protein
MIFKELNIKPKLRKGTGTYKDMYFIDTRPDLVVKVYDKSDPSVKYDIEEEEKFSQEYPDLYAKILKVNYEKGYIIQEKLNIDPFLSDINKLQNILNIKDPIDLTSRIYRSIKNNNPLELKKYKDLLTDKNDKKIFNSLVTFLSKLKNINYIDVHKDNLGYDKNNNIKLVDI